MAVLSGCASHDPAWQVKAEAIITEMQSDVAASCCPEEFNSMLEVFQQGEKLLAEEDETELADEQFILVCQKSQLLNQQLKIYKERIKEEQRLEQIERQAAREEEKRIRLELERKREIELAITQKSLQKRKNNIYGDLESGNNSAQLSSYTVKRGETLPQIAARMEIYNDSALWPLIYRANRDQIRDPYQLWPGQVLKITRNFSKEEAIDARKKSRLRSR